MFNVPGAKKYDFSHFNPIIVAAVVLLICYLGSKNTYYDQFNKVSQLPENRNELSIIQDFQSYISSNKILFNMSLKFAFKITYENFRQSFTIIIDHYGFKSIYHHNNLFDFQLDSNNHLSGFALSSIFGPVNISFMYLEEEIQAKQTNIPGIQLLFPGNTLLSKKDDHFHFSNVYINEQNELRVYFQFPTEYDSDWITFENGRILKLVSVGRVPKDDCASSYSIPCNTFDPITHLFAVPLDSDLNPYSLFLSIFNAIAELSKISQDKIVIWSGSPLTEETSRLLQEMKPLLENQFEILNSQQRSFFKELRIRFKTSHNFQKLTKAILNNNYQDNYIENQLIIVTDQKSKGIFSNEKVNEISSEICKSVTNGCKFNVVDFSNNVDVVSQINKAHFLILPKDKAYFMFPLCANAKVFLISEEQDDNNSNDWMSKMASDLSVDIKFVKYENNNISSSVFNI